MKRKVIALVIVLLIAVGIGSYFFLPKEEKSNVLTLYGNIEIHQVDLSFQVAGRIEKMLKEEGDEVKQGELVAVLEEQDYDLGLRQASAEVEKTLALSKDANSRFERIRELYAADMVSQQEYETLLHTRDKAKADYDAAVTAQDFAQNQLQYTRIYAPEDGTITVRIQEPGANVTKAQPVYTMAKMSPVWIRAYVSEPDLGNIRYGMKATVLTDTTDPQTGKKREYSGYVGYISPVAEFTPKSVQSTDERTSLVYRIRVYVNEADEYLRQGMPTTVTIDLTPSQEGK